MHSILTGTVNCAVLATSTSVLAVTLDGVAGRYPLDQPPPRTRGPCLSFMALLSA